MKPADVQLLYDYHYWAMRRVLEAAAPVAPAELRAAQPVPHGNLWETLAHALAAEVVWRRRMQERVSPTALPPFDALPDLPALAAAWAAQETQMRGYLAGLTEAELHAPFRFRRTEGEAVEFILWQALAHVVNHATQHRAEAGIVLTLLGRSPGDLDMSLYLRTR